ncbi:uncharacterized protein LOC112689215 [Sipha flava]|jgi:hypothetical protein|uniref:Uncharacterized protein LOC112689215 n=1 Tax=Sipha flava TaxID=143950 RepID=A0A8B8G7L4_9HEMI|nr:uncharacterized protein LOC112689215 [Sipha flava]
MAISVHNCTASKNRYLQTKVNIKTRQPGRRTRRGAWADICTKIVNPKKRFTDFGFQMIAEAYTGTDDLARRRFKLFTVVIVVEEVAVEVMSPACIIKFPNLEVFTAKYRTAIPTKHV